MIERYICDYLMFPSMLSFSKIVFDNRGNFRVIVLNKGTPKERVVFAPKKITKLCQKYVLSNAFKDLKPSDNVVSYRKDFSIIDNANPHKNNTYFLHLDIKHFFNRMEWKIFKKVIKNNYPDSVLRDLLSYKKDELFLKNILSYKGKIVQGSVTSPAISNLYLYEFDKQLNQYVKTIKNGVYTRYSDDIFISSSEYIDHSIVDVVVNLLKPLNLKLNYSKIDYSTLRNSVKITGITLKKNKELVLNTKFKKNLKKEIYYALNQKFNYSNWNHLFGLIYYLKSVDLKYFNILNHKYSLNNVDMLTRLKQLSGREH